MGQLHRSSKRCRTRERWIRNRETRLKRRLHLDSLEWQQGNICKLHHQGQRHGWLTSVLFLSLFLLVNGDPRPDLPFIGCAAPEGNRQRCYFYVQEEKTWDEADKACRSHKGAYLATIPDYQTRIFLSKAARPRQNGAWTGGVKQPQHSWRWNSGSTYHGDISENRTIPDAELCGYVNGTYPSIIQTAPCTSRFKYMCSESEMRSIHDPHYVSPWKHTWTWTSAKVDCMNRGMDLAVVNDDNLGIFRQLLEAEEQQEENPRYWVGLSTSRYIWKHSGKEIDLIPFGCGEPSHASERCIEMLADGKYNDTLCEEKRPFICEWVKWGPEILDLGCLGMRCFYYVKEAMTWGQANRTCRHYTDTFLATIPDYHTQYYLRSRVTKFYLSKPEAQSAIMGRTIQVQNGFWTGGRFMFANDWAFMDGTIYKGDIYTEDPFTYYHCGAVKVGNNTFHGLLCDDKARFLCLSTDPDANVFSEQNHFISSAQTQVLDWFRARTNCLDRGMDLASGSMELLQQILTGETGSFWVGLIKSRFVWEHSKKPITHLQFRCDEPNNYRETDEHCMEMWLDGEYNDNICAALKPSVCEWDRAPVTPSSTKSAYFTTPKPAESKSNKWMYASIIIGYIGWVVAIVAIVAIYMKMYGKSSQTSKNLTELKGRLSAIIGEHAVLQGDYVALQKRMTVLENLPFPDYIVTLENEDDPNMNKLLSDDLRKKLKNAAPGIGEYLPLSTNQKLWNILWANKVVNRETMESIRGNNNIKTNAEQVLGLISHLRRGPNKRYFYFRECLLLAGYDYVVCHYLDHAPRSPQSSTMPTTPHGRCAQCATSSPSALSGIKVDNEECPGSLSTEEPGAIQVQPTAQTRSELKDAGKSSFQFPPAKPTLPEAHAPYFHDKYQQAELKDDVTTPQPLSPTTLNLPECKDARGALSFSSSAKDTLAFPVHDLPETEDGKEGFPSSSISIKITGQPDSASSSASDGFGRKVWSLLPDPSKSFRRKTDRLLDVSYTKDANN